MDEQSFFTKILPLFFGLIGGILVAIVDHVLNRRKRDAEIKKLELEYEKLYFDFEQQKQAYALSVAVDYKGSDTQEKTLFDSNQPDIGYDIKGVEGRHWAVGGGKLNQYLKLGKGPYALRIMGY
jgi:hypothetical protein